MTYARFFPDQRTPWREPDEESTDLFPGLVVHDGRVSGSITFGPTRMPLWASYVEWPEVEDGYNVTPEQHKAAQSFARNLFELRGEFARLLLVMADAERCEGRRNNMRYWWETKKHRKRVADQLRRCLAVVED